MLVLCIQLNQLGKDENQRGKGYAVVYNGNNCRNLYNSGIYTANHSGDKNEGIKRRFTGNVDTFIGGL